MPFIAFPFHLPLITLPFLFPLIALPNFFKLFANLFFLPLFAPFFCFFFPLGAYHLGNRKPYFGPALEPLPGFGHPIPKWLNHPFPNRDRHQNYKTQQ